jgi:hypothetical protein
VKTVAIGAVVIGALCVGLGGGKHQWIRVLGLGLLGAGIASSATLIASGH